ncbi:MAG: leucine-rich repeat domain-containing protein [Oscillospiraceae bacterium]|nr:leucine-rich repeat domain-containing protein [Oscillospiraceae bacterium]
MKAKNFTTAALVGIMLLTACSGNNGNTGTTKKPNNSPSSGLINNSTPDSGFKSRFKYKFDSELNGMVITVYEGETRRVIIPDTLEGSPVVKLEDGAFAGLTDITSITIPNSVIKMGDHVFDYCTGLASVTIGSGLTEIGVSTFVNCMNLTSITIPSNVTKIGDYAFDNCSSLTNITIPDSVTEIGYDAFAHCESINATYKGTSYDYQHIEDLYKAING